MAFVRWLVVAIQMCRSTLLEIPMTEANKIRPATKMVEANDARVLIVSKEYRQVPDEQALRLPLVLQVPMLVLLAATSQTWNGDLPFL